MIEQMEYKGYAPQFTLRLVVSGYWNRGKSRVPIACIRRNLERNRWMGRPQMLDGSVDSSNHTLALFPTLGMVENN